MHDKTLRTARLALLSLAAWVLSGCGPRAHIPPRPLAVPAALEPTHPAARLARTLAPTLYQHPKEWFPLERTVAVVHPERRVIAYHLLWRDDVHGSWIPFTVATDQEVAWVAYDADERPTQVWTYWHGTVLLTDWRDHGPVELNVQWGKHGLLPRHLVESDLPATKKLNSFYLFTWLGLPDIWLGNLTRPGPWCFCRSYDSYRDWSQPLKIADRLDAIVLTDDPDETLKAVFGTKYSKKRAWPDFDWVPPAGAAVAGSSDAGSTSPGGAAADSGGAIAARDSLPLVPATPESPPEAP